MYVFGGNLEGNGEQFCVFDHGTAIGDIGLTMSSLTVFFQGPVLTGDR